MSDVTIADIRRFIINEVSHACVITGVVEDPKVPGTFAARIVEDGDITDLMWITNEPFFERKTDSTTELLHETLEEVEFTTWPPTSGEPKFFL